MKKVGGARHKMEEDILKAKNYPHNSLILQLDGMDNQKSYCPRLLDKGKKTAGMLRLPTKIVCGIIYSGYYPEKRKIVMFLNHDQESHNYVYLRYPLYRD